MSKTPNVIRVSDEAIAAALRKNSGLFSYAAKDLGIVTSTVSRRVEKSKMLQGVVADVCERRLDVAEGALVNALQGGEAWAVCFYLKCKGKHRGYCERQEITGKDGGPVETAAVAVSEAELDKIISGT